MLRRRSSYADDLDSRSAIETALQRSDTTFAASVFRWRKTGQVLYLEAGKDLIDTLLSFLLLPVGTALVMLSKSSTPTGLLKFCLDADAKRPSPPEKQYLPEKFYQCDKCSALSSSRGRCYVCWPENRAQPCGDSRFIKGPYYLSAEDVQRQHAFVAEQEPVEEFNRSTGKGFVKENISYTVTDKLEIMPSTTTETINVLNALNIASLADLEVNKVTVTITEVLQSLQSALTSSGCLNDVLGTGMTTTPSRGERSSRDILCFQELMFS